MSDLYQIIPTTSSHHFYQKMLYFAKLILNNHLIPARYVLLF